MNEDDSEKLGAALGRYSHMPHYRAISWIPLTHGVYAIVNAVEFDRVNLYTWRAKWDYHTNTFRAVRSERGKLILMSRQIMGNPIDTKRPLVDHWNGDTCDNRRENLRWVSFSENSLKAKRPRNHTSKHRGVYRATNCKSWWCNIRIAGKIYYIGSFPSEALAFAARSELIRRLNDPYQREYALTSGVLMFALLIAGYEMLQPVNHFLSAILTR